MIFPIRREFKVWLADGSSYTKVATSCHKACLGAFIDGRKVVRVGAVKTDADRARVFRGLGERNGRGPCFECKFTLPGREDVFVVRIHAYDMESAIDDAALLAYDLSGCVAGAGAGLLGVRAV